MFAIVNLDLSSSNRLSLKCTPEKYAELIDREGIIPAPYLARYHWIALQQLDALQTSELKQLIKESYDLVFAKLSKKVKAQLSQK
jgi:predicted DNA-binding protein (MmcQ/YjbR family)